MTKISDPNASGAQQLDQLSTEQLKELAAKRRLIALLPVGSVEPHGPHLPLATDTIISQGVAERAATELNNNIDHALVAPAIPYGVTDYASGFAGAISVPAEALTPFLRAVVAAYLRDGFAHVCLINNHLEPEHDRAVRAAIIEFAKGTASVACPLTRRWGRTLSAEYKSGACHAGSYETSLMMAVAPDTVHATISQQLPPLTISLSSGIRDGHNTFAAMGIERAYTGAPAEASPEEGDALVDRLATMVVTEVNEALTAATTNS